MNIKTVFKISVLFALALGAIPGWAQVPQSGVEGATAGVDPNGIIDTNLDELAFTNVTIPNTGSLWHCVATCSAEARLFVEDNGITVHGRLALEHNSDEVPFTSRRFELTDNIGVDDPDSIVVSTTGKVARLPAGTHRLSCAAAKTVPGTAEPNFRIINSSITVSCSQFHL